MGTSRESDSRQNARTELQFMPFVREQNESDWIGFHLCDVTNLNFRGSPPLTRTSCRKNSLSSRVVPDRSVTGKLPGSSNISERAGRSSRKQHDRSKWGSFSFSDLPLEVGGDARRLLDDVPLVDRDDHRPPSFVRIAADM